MYSQSSKIFWCHLCKIEFPSNSNDEIIKCRIKKKKKILNFINFLNIKGGKCNKEFCEEISDPQNNPKNFVPYNPVINLF